ncbi:MAG: molybdopterin molybdotransferase MoeA [Phycisphaerales bacterium]|nr:molybdopterin molybdotransferase MoeA [Phycisphaerales bacterium]
MIDVDEAQRIVLAQARPLPAVEMPLAEAIWRTLVASVVCDVDYPPFDRSSMDGYAIRAADALAVPVTLRVVGQIAAGALSTRTLQPGETMQINTGAPIPRGADAVVRAESTEVSPSGEAVIVRESVQPGRFITRRATYARAGQTVLDAGSVLTPINIGVAATAGAARVIVYRRPTVAILVTGDELIDIGEKPTGAQIRNSNQYILESLVRAAHCEPVVLGIAGDDRNVLRQKIEEGLRSDVLCLTGGISMGAFDFVPEVLKECGAEFHVHKMAIKPGRPTIFATTPADKLIFALPGNPASALVGFHLLMVPALAALQGRQVVQPLVRAVLRGELSATGDRRSYLPARVVIGANGECEARVLSWHGSGDAIGMGNADALIVQPPRSPAVRDGDMVMLLPFDRE